MSARQSKNGSKKKRSLLFRAARFSLYFLLGFFLLIALLIVGVSLYFSPSRIEKYVKPIIAEAIHGEFTFSIVHFNPLNGVIIKDIRLTVLQDSSQSTLPLRLLTAREASLKYSLKQLLKKRFVVEEILIDEPDIELLFHLPLAEAQPVRAAPDSGVITAPPLPIAFDLQRFKLQNASITVDANDSSAARHLFLSEINLYLDDVRIPPGDVLKQDSLLSGKFKVVLESSKFIFEQRTGFDSLSCNGTLDAQVDVDLNSLENIRISSSVLLKDIGLQLNSQPMIDTHEQNVPLSLDLSAQIDLHREHAQVDSLIFQVQNSRWLELSMRADSLLTRPFISGQVIKSSISIAQLLSLTKTLMPGLSLPEIYLHDANAALTFDGTTFSGFLPDSTSSETLSWAVNLALKNFGATVNRGESLIQNLNFNTAAQGRLGFAKMTDVVVSMNASYDSLAVTLPITPKISSGALIFNAGAKLNEQMFPASAQLAMDINNLLGADIHADMNVRTPSDLGRLAGGGTVSISSFDLSQIPETQAVGTLSTKMDITINTLDSIRAAISVKTDSITMLQQAQLMTLSPLTLTSSVRLSTEPLFQNFHLRDVSIQVNNFLNGHLTGDLMINQQQDITAAADLTDLTLDHAELFEWLPASVRQPLEGVRISGKTKLAADMNLHLQKNDTTYAVTAQLTTLPTNVDFTYQNFFIKNIQVHSQAGLNSETGGHFEFALSVDSTLSLIPARMLFLNNTMGFRISMPNFQTVSLDTGYLSLPDFKTNGVVSAKIESMLTHPLIKARLELHQAAKDTLVITKDILFKGFNDLALAVVADSSKAHVDISAKTTDLSIYLPNNTRISRVNADVSFSQDVDLLNETMIGSSQPIVQTPSDGLVDYFLYRNYYAGSLNKSSIFIRKVEAANYVVENIHVDAYLGNGRIEIPYYALDVYGGNIGGQFVMAAGAQDLLDVSYRLSAHFSGINSSLLVPSAKAGSHGIITAHAELQGRGLDVQKGIDLDGYFNILQIESKVADNLLRSLDPEGKDSGIRSTRILINRGFKPRLFQFEIRHGFCYPAVYFDQPWYFPVRLSGGGIELSRIPIASLTKLNQDVTRSSK
jgi:hypothetical protein